MPCICTEIILMRIRNALKSTNSQIDHLEFKNSIIYRDFTGGLNSFVPVHEGYNPCLLFPNCADKPRYGVSQPVVSCTLTKKSSFEPFQDSVDIDTIWGSKKCISGGSRVTTIYKSQKHLHKRCVTVRKY